MILVDREIIKLVFIHHGSEPLYNYNVQATLYETIKIQLQRPKTATTCYASIKIIIIKINTKLKNIFVNTNLPKINILEY